MPTYHIHIQGLVQGVGFRPLISKIAKQFLLLGEVCNTLDGLHIFFNAEEETATSFVEKILNDPPKNALIRSVSFEEVTAIHFENFKISESIQSGKATILLTPDIAICADCKAEIKDPNNTRYQYPFTTCLNCGPRYSISHALPYDRVNTSMQTYEMCIDCQKEITDITNPRHFSQTNSCPNCAVEMQLFGSNQKCLSTNWKQILETLLQALAIGNIVAVKGIGGYLLLCDATQSKSIQNLRERKNRPHKPLAVMFPTIESVASHLNLREVEREALFNKSAPIVLCELKDYQGQSLAAKDLAPGLSRIGAVLPYTPLLQIITEKFGKPLVATSGNISGSPILFNDQEAIENLLDIADYLLCFKRDIVAPQDDSLLLFGKCEQKIVLRRSRGLAPNYFPNPWESDTEKIWAMGSEMKSSFALLDHPNLYVSQYLGDLGSVESQDTFAHTLQQLSSMLGAEPNAVLIDQHPLYFSSEYGKKLAKEKSIPVVAIQHHEAHFAAVLAENSLLDQDDKILGIIWDGTGFGTDKQIWGGELFCFENKEIFHLNQLNYFPQLLGDKMSREPRISALSLVSERDGKGFGNSELKGAFTDTEWKYYQLLVQQEPELFTSSMGRFLDGIAALLGVCSINSYEGEAAMLLETLAQSCEPKTSEYYTIEIGKEGIFWRSMLTQLCADINQGLPKPKLALKVFNSLVKLIANTSKYYDCKQLAFSGGVFQNSLLCDILIQQLSDTHQLYFHQQMSPNDECISFGQIAAYQLQKKRARNNIQ